MVVFPSHTLAKSTSRYSKNWSSTDAAFPLFFSFSWNKLFFLEKVQTMVSWIGSQNDLLTDCTSTTSIWGVNPEHMLFDIDAPTNYSLCLIQVPQTQISVFKLDSCLPLQLKYIYLGNLNHLQQWKKYF